MENMSAQSRLYAGMQSVCTDLLADTLQERGRGFASDREAWALLKEIIENCKSRAKNIEDLHKDMWCAVKDRNEDAFCAFAEEAKRAAFTLSMEWATASVMASIVVLQINEEDSQ